MPSKLPFHLMVWLLAMALVGCSLRGPVAPSGVVMPLGMAISDVEGAASAGPTSLTVSLEERYKVQALPDAWDSAEVTLSNPQRLVGPQVKRLAPSSPATVYTGLRAGTGYDLAVKLYSGGTLKAYGDKAGIALVPGSNKVTIWLYTLGEPKPLSVNATGLAVDAEGNLYISDFDKPRVLRRDTDGLVARLAGTGTSGSSPDGTVAASAMLREPRGLATAADGTVAVVDAQDYKLRQVAKTGLLDTAVGTGGAGYSGDGGPAKAATVMQPRDVVRDAAGNTYLSDKGSHVIRKVSPEGTITTLVGTGLNGPTALALGPAGHLYVADTGNHAVRKVNLATGALTTVATGALSSPSGLAVDASGTLYVSDTGNHQLKQVAKDGAITTLAGVGSVGYSGDGGAPEAAQLSSPGVLAWSPDGKLYLADTGNKVIRIIEAGIITTLTGIETSPPPGGGSSGGTGAPSGVALIFQVAGALLPSPGILATNWGMSLGKPVLDASGNMYLPDPDFNRVLRVDAVTGFISTVAGTGVSANGYNGDGIPATTARIFGPQDVAFDGAGNLFITDTNNQRIRRVDAVTGLISTVAGTGTFGYNGDGIAATTAHFRNPSGVAVDGAGNLFITDTNNQRIRRVDALTGLISTVAGTGTSGYNGDGIAATTARLREPEGVEIDAAGHLFIADRNNVRIRRVDAVTGLISTVAGNGTIGYNGDGIAATAARLGMVNDLSLDAAGNLFIADTSNHRIRRVDVGTGLISTVAGTGTLGYNGDGLLATAAQLRNPSGVVVDGTGNIFIADKDNYRFRRVDAGTGLISTVAGNGTPRYSGDGIAATAAQIGIPTGVACDAAGNVFIADSGNNRIRRVDAGTGLISTVAGDGTQGYNGDGIAATTAQLRPSGVAIDAAGNIFIADVGNHRIRRVDAGTGLISTVAGDGTFGYNGDGIAATTAHFRNPRALALDAAGNIFIADEGNNRIRRVDAGTGLISTVAGTGTSGYNGDGIAATAAQVSNPIGVAVDAAGNVYIADEWNGRVRRVDAGTGLISTVAGGGGDNSDGIPATTASLSSPRGLAVDGAGNLYVADRWNGVVRRVDAITGLISTVAGDFGQYGYNGNDIPATTAWFSYPYDVAISPDGNLYMADFYNNMVRKVRVQ